MLIESIPEALSGRPALVLVVDDIGVRMFPRGLCRTGVTGQVWMPFNKPIVPVQKFNRIVGGPKAHRQQHGRRSNSAQGHKTGGQTEFRAQPARQGIRDEPAGVRQRELRSKKRGAINLAG